MLHEYPHVVTMFEKRVERVRILNPLLSFAEDVQEVEHRKDPLTGKWSRINIQRSQRVKQGEANKDYQRVVEQSRKNCFFCPENIDGSTPKFPHEIIPEGYIEKGETRVFPNLFPFAKYHAVATLSHTHFQKLSDFKISQISDTFLACLDFCRQVQLKDRDARFPTLSWNHLFPAGASMVHPHVQIILDREASNMNRTLIEASKRYLDAVGRVYWEDLISEEERAGKRFIGRSGSAVFLASYSPIGNNEIMAVFPGKSSLTDLEEGDVNRLSKGVHSILQGYSRIGIESFNLTTYSGDSFKPSEGANLAMRMVSRPSPREFYTSDVGFLEGLHFERVVETIPEDVAAALRKFFPHQE